MASRGSRPSRVGGRLRGVGIIVAIGLVISISTIVGFYTDFLWFKEVQFEQVFWKTFSSKVLLALGFGVAFFILMLVNLLIVRRLMPVFIRVGEGPDPLEPVRAAITSFFRPLALAISAFLALLFGAGVSGEWQRVLLAMNAVDFGSIDPVFSRDIGFYIFRLPMLKFIYGWAFSTLVVVLIATVAAHYLTGGIRPQSSVERVTSQVKAHLSVLMGLLALLRAWGYRLNQYDLLYSTRGDVIGASYTDINAELPALKLLVIISVIAGILFLVNLRFRGWALPLVGVGLWIAVATLAAGVYPFLVQRFRVEPAQFQKEEPFIARNIKGTRAAYGLDSVTVREHAVQSDIDAKTLQDNAETVEDIRLQDPRILKVAYKQLQEIRPYYEFDDVDVDRYKIGDGQRQVMLSVRELSLASLEDPSWQNNHLFYTHGYGAVASPTNKTTASGQPEFLLKNIPPETSVPELKIEQGGIYFGERNREYSLVGTKQLELDYELQDQNSLTSYKGKGGVQASSPLRRLAFAWRFRNVNLLISGLIQPETKIIYNRQIRDRLQKAAPFISFDADPYAVIADGRIVWLIDGYTTSAMYPYAQRTDFESRTLSEQVGGPSVEGTGNYIRNSVKATVDAYDGTVRLYAWDEKDPILRAWRGAFPDLFTDKSQMPDVIRDHVRYPEDLFRIQSEVYARYHVTDGRTFFTRLDRWVIPRDPNFGESAAVGGAQRDEIQPYYVLMKLPGATKEEYVLILPFNPRGKPNMVSYLAAKSDPDEYGSLVDFRFPRTRQITGVGQIHSQINQTQEISRDISLLDQRGSNVAFGNLLVIPLGDSILYVQPVFLQAESNAIPELEFVILATQDRIVRGATLEEALALLTGGQGVPTTPKTDGGSATTDKGQLVKEALQHLQAAEDAARKGDWATYGREQELAKKSLEQADQQSSGSPSPSPSPTG